MKKIFTQNLNSKGAASIFLVMAVLAAVLAIALGSSSVVSTEIRSNLDSGESTAAYYAAESGMEKAMYDKSQNIVPNGNRCAATDCPGGSTGVVCAGPGSWTCTSSALTPALPYCIIVTPTNECDPNNITSIKSVGEYKSTRRSIEIAF